MSKTTFQPAIQFKNWEDLTFADDFMFHAVMKNKTTQSFDYAQEPNSNCCGCDISS